MFADNTCQAITNILEVKCKEALIFFKVGRE